MRSILLVTAAVAASFLALECATAPPAAAPGAAAPQGLKTASTPAGTNPESALKARVVEYWKRRQMKDLSGMYEFYSAGYRAAHPRTEFLAMTRLVRYPILEFRIARVAIDANGKRAKVTVGYRSSAPQIPEPFDSEVTDNWVLDPDGLWYKEQDELILPFPKGSHDAQAGRDPTNRRRGLE